MQTNESGKYFTEKYFIENLLYLCPPHWFRKCLPADPTKRESGENPEQTRYCKSYKQRFDKPIATVPINWGGKAAQNEDKSGDLPM